jgi:hypothetical protein
VANNRQPNHQTNHGISLPEGGAPPAIKPRITPSPSPTPISRRRCLPKSSRSICPKTCPTDEDAHRLGAAVPAHIHHHRDEKGQHNHRLQSLLKTPITPPANNPADHRQQQKRDAHHPRTPHRTRAPSGRFLPIGCPGWKEYPRSYKCLRWLPLPVRQSRRPR